MKRALILGALVATGLTAVAVSAQRAVLPPPGKIEKIGDNLYKVFGGGGNTTLFVRSDGVVLVDTKMPGNGQAILDQLRTVTDKPVTMIINTHSHPDHVGSNDFFKNASPTIDVVAQENAKKWLSSGPRVVPATIPTRTYTDRLTLGAGKDRIDLFYFGAGHTDNDSFVVFPSERAMVAGDLMAWHMAPLIDPGSGGSVIALADTMEKASKGIKGVDKVIEGHGDVNSWAGFRLMTEFDRALLTAAKAAYDKGEPPEAALAVLQKNPKFSAQLGDQLLPGLEYGNTPKARALMNINVAYQEFAGEKVTTNFGGPLPVTGKHKGSASDITGLGRGAPGGGGAAPAPKQ